MMTDVAAVKWAVFDLLKVLDPLHDGRYHGEFRRIAQDLGYGCTKTWRTRAMNDGSKWATFALLKTLDSFYAGELHDEFAAISSLLGLELPVLPPEAEANGEQESQQDRILQFLAAQTEPVSLARIIAELGIKKWSATSALYRLQRQGRIEHPARDCWQILKPG
jgi:hypothetical protein